MQGPAGHRLNWCARIAGDEVNVVRDLCFACNAMYRQQVEMLAYRVLETAREYEIEKLCGIDCTPLPIAPLVAA